MQGYLEQGLIVQSRPGSVPALKRYLDEQEGTPIGSVWSDILSRGLSANENLGYPTQRPMNLIERIVRSSSNEGDIVLDAFCGSGTTLHVAQNLERQWIGIDKNPAACRVAAERLMSQCHLQEGKDFFVRDLPKTARELEEYSPLEFESWAVSALNTMLATPRSIISWARFGDSVFDGQIYPASAAEEASSEDRRDAKKPQYPVQVKQKDGASRFDVQSLETAMRRQGRNRGFFVAFDFTLDAQEEIERILREENLHIVPITVREILENQESQRL